MGIPDIRESRSRSTQRGKRCVRVRGLAGVLIVGALVASACAPARSEGTIQVFAASSLTDAFGEMVVAFHVAEPDVDVELVLGGSSSLREQILDGAPADVFASANPQVMAGLVDAGSIASTPATFATNGVALAVPPGNPAGITSVADLSRGDLVVGVCAAEVPCGVAAAQLFQLANVQPDADTHEPNVRSLLAKIEEGELDVGVVYRSDLVASTSEAVPLPPELMVEVDYTIAVVAGEASNRSTAEANQFLDFVLSPEGQAILERHGLRQPVAS